MKIKYLKKSLLVIFLPLLAFSLVNHTGTTEKIRWKDDYKLRFEDFTGTPEEQSSHSAMSYIQHRYSLIHENDSALGVTISCYFVSGLSWFKNKDDHDLLLHEQLHFDIGELYARKMRREISQFKKAKYDSLAQKVTAVFERINQKYKERTLAYDFETNHSINNPKQQKWNLMVKKELLLLEDYSDTITVVPCQWR